MSHDQLCKSLSAFHSRSRTEKAQAKAPLLLQVPGGREGGTGAACLTSSAIEFRESALFLSNIYNVVKSRTAVAIHTRRARRALARPVSRTALWNHSHPYSEQRLYILGEMQHRMGTWRASRTLARPVSRRALWNPERLPFPGASSSTISTSESLSPSAALLCSSFTAEGCLAACFMFSAATLTSASLLLFCSAAALLSCTIASLTDHFTGLQEMLSIQQDNVSG